jgi:hypothetical protein
MLGYQHQVGSRSEMMLMLPSLPLPAAPVKQEHFTQSKISTPKKKLQ